MRALIVMMILFVHIAQKAEVKAQTTQRVDGLYPTRSVRLFATASVIDNLVLTNMRDVNLSSPTAVSGVVTISPVSSPYAGLMRIEGRPGKTVRITYLTNETLLEETGTGGFVKARYQISGFQKDNQLASILLDAGEAIVRLGEDGRYYIWLGSILDLTAAQPGVYNSEFIIEVEGGD